MNFSYCNFFAIRFISKSQSALFHISKAAQRSLKFYEAKTHLNNLLQYLKDCVAHFNVPNGRRSQFRVAYGSLNSFDAIFLHWITKQSNLKVEGHNRIELLMIQRLCSPYQGNISGREGIKLQFGAIERKQRQFWRQKIHKIAIESG